MHFLWPYIKSPLPSTATSVLKMDTVCLFETLVSTYEFTQRQNPEQHRHCNYKFYIAQTVMLWWLRR
jgi:hypothetical protein